MRRRHMRLTRPRSSPLVLFVQVCGLCPASSCFTCGVLLAWCATCPKCYSTGVVSAGVPLVQRAIRPVCYSYGGLTVQCTSRVLVPFANPFLQPSLALVSRWSRA